MLIYLAFIKGASYLNVWRLIRVSLCGSWLGPLKKHGLEGENESEREEGGREKEKEEGKEEGSGSESESERKS